MTYVSTHQGVIVIDGETNRIVENVTAGTANVTYGALAVNPTTNMAYVSYFDFGDFMTDSQSEGVIVIDGETNRIVENLTLIENADCGRLRCLQDIAVNPETNVVYINNAYSNTTSVIDGITYQQVHNITMGEIPLYIAVNPNTNLLYVTSFRNTTSVIDGITYQELDDINTGYAPRAIAVNPRTNVVYIGNYNSNTTSVIDRGTNTAVGNTNTT
jgi:YVTN family beta-propeller protein